MSDIILESEGPTTILTMNRPHRHNALTREMQSAMREIIAELDANPEKRVLIITGAGEKAFSSGADLTLMRQNMGKFGKPIVREPDIAGIGAGKKPIIAAINGLAVGGGFEIALCCDIRLAAEAAWFGLPETAHGFLPGVASMLLPRMMPSGVVMDMLMCGERLNAVEAHRFGLVQKVVPANELMNEALRKADRVANMSPSAVEAAKKMVRYQRDLMVDEHCRYYQALMDGVLNSDDIAERLDQFGARPRTETSNI